MKIAVIGSCSDLEGFEQNRKLCEGLGRFLAGKKATVLFSIENDMESIPTLVARSARQAGAKVVGFTHGDNKEDLTGVCDEVVITLKERGGPREHMLISEADAVIGICGGSGTLMEIAMAYQQKKRIVLFRNSGGWCDKLEQGCLDSRKRVEIMKVDSIEGLKALI